MKLSRRNNVAEAFSFKKFTDLALYVRPILEIYQASEVHRDHWLTDKEKDFYVAAVVHVLQGHLNPIASESVQIYRKYFDSSTPDSKIKGKISDYIGRVKRKDWLRYDKFEKVVELPEPFKSIKAMGDYMNFNLKYEYVGEGTTDR